MSAIKDGGLAFPGTRAEMVEFEGYPEHQKMQRVNVEHSGMSLRDWFAGQALAGMLANASTISGEDGLRAFYKVAAQASYICADAMIVEREKGGAS